MSEKRQRKSNDYREENIVFDEKDKYSDSELMDIFDHDVLIDITKDVCVLCKGDHVAGLKLKEKFNENAEEDGEDYRFAFEDPNCIVDRYGVWASKYSLANKTTRKSTTRMFIHFHCAYFSPQSSCGNNSWFNLVKEIRRGRALACKGCNERGATVGCQDSRCSVVMHVPCAAKFDHCQYSTNLTYYCIDHHTANVAKVAQIDQEFAKDMSRGLESVPVTVSSGKDCDGAPPPVLSYTVRNLDSDGVNSSLFNIHEMDYCTCDGLCNDVATCACLQSGRNYTFNGTLIPSIKQHEIHECNMRCACSVRRCSNRVVGKGLGVKLEVFRTIAGAGAPTKGKRKQYRWGVRTLEFIPENAFVCEITGVFTRGGT
jgi:hypothetical protein